MKYLLILSVVIAAVTATALPSIAGPYDYHRKYGIPAAEAIRTAEAARRSSRIVGGEQTGERGIPYHVGMSIPLTSGWTSVCGATILTNTKSVTAAHCWNDGSNQAVVFNMVFGSGNLYGNDGTRISSSDVQMHERWNINNMIENDIAMITHDRVEYHEYIQPAALPTGSQLFEDFAGELATASGFGMTSNQPTPAGEQVLSSVRLPVMTNAACRNILGGFILDSTICTDGTGNKNICSGDSGGPLVIFRNDRAILIGVVSFGAGNCVNSFPAGYARTSYYNDWIQSRLTT